MGNARGAARVLASCAVLTASWVAGCGEPMVPPMPDGGGTLDAAGMDAPAPPDGAMPVVCLTDDDCDDDVFCNGEETCRPGATDADENGCVVASMEACAA